MLQPKRTKFRKAHKGRIKGAAKGATARRAMTRQMKRAGRVWIRLFPDVPVSKKPTEVRMGKGKGTPEFWVAKVKPGRIMFEIDGVNEATARESLRLAAAKLPIKTRVVARIEG
jgi:large subunit ribosomal protein L16